MALFAQHGYGKGDKINIGLINDEISGVIFSPKAEQLIKLKTYIKKIKKINSNAKIYFDPQFYICALQGDIVSSKLISYEYCNLSLNRGVLSDYKYLNHMCEQVFDVQTILEVSEYFSPTIRFADFDDKDSQIALNLAKLSCEKITQPDSALYVSLCINEAAFNNYEKMNAFLDIITLLDVKGFYIIIDRNNINSKVNEINPSTLANIMVFIHSLSLFNGFDVIVGYSDLLSLPLAAVSNADFATGWFSNTKRFSINNFVRASGGHRPKKRYTSGILMNTVLLLPEFKAFLDTNLINNIITESPYNKNIIPRFDESQWSDEISCLHNWHVIKQLIQYMQMEKDIECRLSCLQSMIENAKKSYEKIKSPITLDPSSKGGHLNMWSEAIKIFKESMV